MTQFHVLTAPGKIQPIPEVRRIGFGHLIDALVEGWRDFWERPSHLVFLGLIYAFVGVLLGLWTSGANAWPLLFPLISGFALVGPIAVLPLYEMSRRREHGLDTSWRSAFGVFRAPSMPAVAAVAVMLLVLFGIWLGIAQMLYESLFGPGSPATLAEFWREVTTTEAGQTLMIWGNLIGLGFAIVVLSIAVITVPLLIDRDIGAAVAVQTSVRATLKNPLPIAIWGLMVAALLVLGAVPVLMGLAIVVPVLGHATWHLYRRIIV